MTDRADRVRSPSHRGGGWDPCQGPTAAELDTLVSLLVARDVESIAIGGADVSAARAGAAALAHRWRDHGGRVVDIVHWPVCCADIAASWLPAARRFTRDNPDGWAVTGPIDSWARFAVMLREHTAWEPARTVGFAALADSRLVAVAGRATVAGMSGALPDGGTWHIQRYPANCPASDAPTA